MKYKNVAFIPLRGGSKSIQLKNIKKINNRPLAYWVMDAAVNSEKIDRVFISTDDEKIKDITKKYNSNKIEVISRSKETATDNASTELAMIEFAYNYDFENIILIQATSPLLKSEYLDKGIELVEKNKFDSVLSVVRQKRFIWEKSDNEYIPSNYDFNNRPLRQGFEGFLVENGAFYIISKNNLLKTKSRLSSPVGVVEMPESTYFEIDEPTDWLISEKLLEFENINKIDLDTIKMVITDSDGVLTDAGMYYSENGDELKKFNTKDGMGFKLLKEAGIKTAIITGEKRKLIKNRAEKIKADEIFMGITDKVSIIKKISKKYNIKPEEMAYIGDDINDYEAINYVGFGCCTKDANYKLKKIAKYITKTNGGNGAFREIADIILYNEKWRNL